MVNYGELSNIGDVTSKKTPYSWWLIGFNGPHTLFKDDGVAVGSAS